MNDDFFLTPELTRNSRGELMYENVSLAHLAQTHGTPCYVYSKAAICAAWHEFEEAFNPLSALICYAVKANSNLSLLRLLAQRGAGFDIVSGGELGRVVAAGGDPRKVVFSGVGKSRAEMEQALEAGILCFNVESRPELDRLSNIATGLGMRAPVSLRVNPDVDPKTHRYIATGLKQSKFGVAYEEALALYEHARALSGVEITGIDCHIGSQITALSPFLEALERVLQLIERLSKIGITLHHLDLGGGLGIRYHDEQPIALSAYAQEIGQRLRNFPGRLLLEPGRRIMGNSGLLLTRVEYRKSTPDRCFVIVDGAMNDLIRPALYDAWHEIVPVQSNNLPEELVDVVGPVCETGDILATQRKMAVTQDDLLAILSTGAYGASMGSNYNARPRPTEILVDGVQAHVIRRRETLEAMLMQEWPPMEI